MNEDDVAGVTAERIKGYVILAITMGARVAEVHASRRRDQQRQAERQSSVLARQVVDQQRVEASMVRHQFRDVATPDWWQRATPSEIGAVYATARSYGAVDAELAGLTRYMADEIGVRYGIDAEQTAAEAARAAGTGEAVAYMAEANLAEGLAVPAELREMVDGWDDPQRRASLTARLERFMPNEPDAQQARLIADTMQGEPAAKASAAKTTGATRIVKPARAAKKTIER